MSDHPHNLAEIFEFLDELRSSGDTNMFGASPYIEQAFDIDRKVARSVLSSWMKTFDPDVGAEFRAYAAEVVSES